MFYGLLPMKKMGMVVCACLLSIVAYAQEKEWNTMTEEEQQTCLLEKARTMIAEFGPGYMREDASYMFLDMPYDNQDPKYKAYFLKDCYQLFFYIDGESGEVADRTILANIYFGKEDGRPFEILFGNNAGICFLDTPYEEMRKQAGHLVIPYRKQRNACVRYFSTQEEFDRADGVNRQVLDKAYEAIRAFGPDYYRPEADYDIALRTYEQDGQYDSVSRNNGREYYFVTFTYDLNKERFKTLHLVAVSVWKDTGQPWHISFGNGQEMDFLTVPYEEARKQPHTPVPLECEVSPFAR